MGIDPAIIKYLLGMATTYAVWLTRSVIKAEIELDHLFGQLREMRTGMPGQHRRRHVLMRKVLFIGRRKRSQGVTDLNHNQGEKS